MIQNKNNKIWLIIFCLIFNFNNLYQIKENIFAKINTFLFIKNYYYHFLQLYYIY